MKHYILKKISLGKSTIEYKLLHTSTLNIDYYSYTKGGEGGGMHALRLLWFHVLINSL